MKSPHFIFLTLFGLRVLAILRFAEAQNQEGFISLDCGLPLNESPYIESESQIQFSSDENFIQSGKIGKIPENLESPNLKPYSTLRYFPDGIRNCYDLRVEEGNNYLIRAIFFYENYDGLNVSPEFDIYLGPNKWTTIDLQKESFGSVKEVIHIPRSTSLQICLVKTGATTPMISTLELRPLANDTYIAQSGSLKLNFRMYLSNSTFNLRYPKDVYDRTWIPYFQPEWTQISTTANVSNQNHYDPPQAVLKVAATPTNLDAPLMINWTLENPDDQIYLYRHFAEIQDIKANDTREFDCVLNGEKINTQVFSPKYLEIKTMLTTIPRECKGGICRMQLIRTQRSTLPPLLNGFEVYSVLQLPQAQTNENQVVAIKNIKSTYGLSKISWQGDPCVPMQFLWDGLNCNITDISTAPKIISLNLSSSGLTGTIVPAFHNLTHLKSLDLSNNTLSGMVPEFLASMTSLLVINLSGNNLSGSIPQALRDREREGLKLYVLGNKNLCLSTTCIDKPKKKFPVKIVAPIASIAAIVVMMILIFVFMKKMSSRNKSEPWIKTKRRRFTYSEVLEMTKNLQRPLGEGGFGIVYHGDINGSEQVAVKLLSETSAQGYKEFKAEVELLLRVHHINLVSLVGYCDEQDHFALIYEYMSNGDLHQHLSGKHGGTVLNWGMRLQIAIEAALGLEYLHIGCKPAMVHRDVKSTNILLDEEFNAKIADFGLSRSFQVGNDDQSRVSTVVAGTLGYLDPEYYLTSELSEKSDIYSFGILLLEIITNQRVIDQTRERPNIAEWVTFVINKEDTSKIVDPKLQGNYEPRSVWSALEVAMSCANPSSAKRPNMSQVIIKLKECLETENARTSRIQDMDSHHSSSAELRVTVTFDSDLYPKPR